MSIENNITKEPEAIRLIDEKLNELIVLLHENGIDNENALKLQQRIDQAIKNASRLTNKANSADEFSILLSNPQTNTKLIKQYLRSERMSKFVLVAISLTMVILGLGMIIMPAPPFFEMFTIFYFNRNDGITIMDLISLLIILSGVYLLIKGIYRKPAIKRLIKSRQ